MTSCSCFNAVVVEGTGAIRGESKRQVSAQSDTLNCKFDISFERHRQIEIPAAYSLNHVRPYNWESDISDSQ